MHRRLHPVLLWQDTRGRARTFPLEPRVEYFLGRLDKEDLSHAPRDDICLLCPYIFTRQEILEDMGLGIHYYVSRKHIRAKYMPHVATVFLENHGPEGRGARHPPIIEGVEIEPGSARPLRLERDVWGRLVEVRFTSIGPVVYLAAAEENRIVLDSRGRGLQTLPNFILEPFLSDLDRVAEEAEASEGQTTITFRSRTPAQTLRARIGRYVVEWRVGGAYDMEQYAEEVIAELSRALRVLQRHLYHSRRGLEYSPREHVERIRLLYKKLAATGLLDLQLDMLFTNLLASLEYGPSRGDEIHDRAHILLDALEDLRRRLRR